MPSTPLPEDRRKEIFLVLVQAQDDGLPPAPSRKAVAERFGITEARVRRIEQEGLDKEWPPL